MIKKHGGKRPGSGRKKPPTKTEQITIKVTPEFKDKLKSFSEKKGVTITSAIEKAINWHIDTDISLTGKKVNND